MVGRGVNWLKSYVIITYKWEKWQCCTVTIIDLDET